MSKKLFIEELSIKNFRAFKRLVASNFGQINLITGENNSGKTALLEALYLCIGPTNPSLWLNINGRRGLGRVSPEQSTVPYLFYKMDVSQPINFKIKTLNHPDSQLQIKYLEPTSYEISKPSNELEAQTNSQLTVSDTEEAVTVELNFTFEGREPIVTKAAIFPNKIKGEGERKAIYPTSVYISVGTSFNLGAEAEHYDQLNRDNLIPKYEQLLRRTVIPNLRRTSLGIENGVTMIHGDVGYGLVPLTLLGSGGRRLNSILLALTSSKDGVVLIDEIENSFHHSVLDGVWTAIAEIVESDGCQIFAATHSDECIKAALKIFDEKENLDFRLHRLEKKDNKTEIFTFDKEQLEVALETGWEVR